MASGPEILDDPESIVVENTIFVAVGKDVNKYRSLLSWAMQNSGGKRICILIVDQPTRWINILGAKTPISSVREEMATEAQEKRRQRTREIANQYILICGQRGAQAQKLLREGDCVKKEIVEVIRLHKIKHLVMGSELRRYCTRMDLKSEKARYVREKAPVFCLMHFVCRGNIIVVREASAETEPSSPTSVVDIECNYEEQDGSMFRTHSSALRSSSIERSLDIGTLCRTIQQVMTEFPERRGHMGQEAEEEIRGRWEELKELVQRLTEAALKREKEVHEIRSQFAALQDKVDELQVERDNLLTEVQGRMLGSLALLASLLSVHTFCASNFHPQVRVLSQVRHAHLVKLIGFAQKFLHSYMNIYRVGAWKIDSLARIIILHYHGRLEYVLRQSCILSSSIFTPLNLTVYYTEI